MNAYPDLTVLVVDDDRNCREVLARLLTKVSGCRVIEAENGVEGLKILAEERPDLIFLDLMMPKMSGQEMLAEIRSRPDLRDIPVVICSAVDELDQVKAIIELGVTDYILKPYAFDTLFVKLTAALKKIPPRPSPRPSGPQPALRKLLLITEDVQLLRFIQASTGPDFCVLHTKDPLTAIRLATAERPEAVFLVPPLSGGSDVGLARKLRSLPEIGQAKLIRLFPDLSTALRADHPEAFDGSFVLTADPVRFSEWLHQVLGPGPFRIKQEPGTLIVELFDPDFDRYRDRLLEALDLNLRTRGNRHLIFDITTWRASDPSGGTGLSPVIAQLRTLGFEVTLLDNPSSHPSPPERDEV